MARTAVRSASTMSAEVMCSMRSFRQTADTGVLSEAPGYALIRLTAAAHCRTGQRTGSPDARWVTVSIRSSFFCHSKVMDTTSAAWSQG